MEIIESYWFEGQQPIGIVVTQNQQKEIRAFIGIGIGSNDEIDAKYIAEWGTPIHLTLLKEIVNKIESEKLRVKQ